MWFTQVPEENILFPWLKHQAAMWLCPTLGYTCFVHGCCNMLQFCICCNYVNRQRLVVFRLPFILRKRLMVSRFFCWSKTFVRSKIGIGSPLGSPWRRAFLSPFIWMDVMLFPIKWTWRSIRAIVMRLFVCFFCCCSFMNTPCEQWFKDI